MGIILVGDTNCNPNISEDQDHYFKNFDLDDLQACNNDPSPSNASSDNGSASGKHMIDLYDTYGLKQLIDGPTRQTLHTSTLIDYVAVSDKRNIVDSGVLK